MTRAYKSWLLWEHCTGAPGFEVLLAGETATALKSTPLLWLYPHLHSPMSGADRDPHKGFCSPSPHAVFRTSQGIFTVGLVSGNHVHTGVKRKTGKNETIQNNVILKINDKGQNLHLCSLPTALLLR